jgi:hypothetical protein
VLPDRTQQDDRDLGMPVTDMPGKVDAIHERHLHIGKDQIVMAVAPSAPVSIIRTPIKISPCSVNLWLMPVFRAVKTPFSFMVEKRKPSIMLGEIIKLLLIIKLTLTILHLVKG